jgi:hypothetical protein
LQNSQPESSSRKTNLVPALNLASLKAAPSTHQQQSHSQGREQAAAGSSRRGIFGRHPFQEFQEAHQHEEFNLETYPEMLKLREHAIELKEKTEKKLLKQLHKANQLSPRTYERKRRDLETWVSKEQEEVKRTRKVFEEEWYKT